MRMFWWPLVWSVVRALVLFTLVEDVWDVPNQQDMDEGLVFI
jgi:hypothetical protein